MITTELISELKAVTSPDRVKENEILAQHCSFRTGGPADLFLRAASVSELEKVLLGLPEESRRITPQIVEDRIGVSKDFNGFELRDAIVNRNVYKANQIINYFDKNPKAGSIYSFLPMLFNYFQNLMIAFYSPNKGSQEEVAAWLELRSSWAAKDYMTGMRNFTAMKTMQIISKLREIDAKSKGLDNPNTPPEELMKELIFYILH